MTIPSRTPLFSVEQIQSQLENAFHEAAISPDKQVYQTSGGIRALSLTEARTDQSAQRINPNNRVEALSLVMKRLETQASANNSHEQIAQMFSMIMDMQAPPVLDKARLKYTAEVEGFGYKKANLDQVTELCDEDFGPFKVRVPAYEGISSNAIQRLLKRKCGVDIPKRWKAILDKHFPPDRLEIRADAMKSKKFPEGFLTDCALLRQEITDAFRLLVDRVDDEGGLDSLLDTNNLTPLINRVSNQNERLMVRSTGKNEDTVELANAGGNVSVPNVIPSAEEVLNANEDVVTSYFGEKSLKQRLGGGDRSLFDPLPLTPVLVQRMIGEKSPAAIPLCGVMFTEDPESKVSGAAGATETSGNTVIQVAFGHNEAVVNSLIPVDTYYATDDNSLFSIIRVKTHRMVPTENSGELQLQANDSTIASQASLSKPMVDTLKAFARRLEQFYGQPMDVEFVIDEKERTIYIVQARPIVHRVDTAPASYISDPKKLGDHKILKGSAIGAAGGGVRHVQSHEILTASTISEALDKYQELEDATSIKAIVVGKMAPSTSHWATIFRNEGIPVLHLDQLESMQSLLENPNAHFLISPQQGLIANLGAESAATLAELQAAGICVAGWVDYPAAAAYSLCLQFQPSEQLTDDAIKDICPALRDPKKWSRFQKNASRVHLQEIFEVLRNAQGEELHLALAMLLFAFRHTLDYRNESLDADQQLRAKALKSHALALVTSIKTNGEFSPTHANYSRKLLPIHFLKALVYAQPSAEDVVDGDSLALDLREIREEQVLAQELQKEGITLINPYSLSLLRLGRFALTPEIAKSYRDYVVSLDRSGSSSLLQDLARLVNQLNKLDMLVSWLNMIFPKNPDVAMQLEAFNRQATLYKTLAEKREMLNALNVSAFGSKKSFQTQWRVLNTELLHYVKSDQFATEYKNADASGKLAMIAFMYQVVDKFDLSIKALEGSSKAEFTTEEKLKLFQTMLKGYYSLAGEWLVNFDFPPYTRDTISTCLKEIQPAIFKPGLSASDLRFSKHFDLTAFGSLSGAIQKKVIAPQSLEDGFSALHRELLAMLNLLFQGVSSTPIPMPPLLKRVTAESGLKNPLGVELNARGVTVYYSKTLREHGVQYVVNQPVGREKLTLSVRFSAENEADRWDKITHFILLLKVQGKFDITDLEMTSRGVGYTFHLDDNDNLETLREIIAKTEQFTCGRLEGAVLPNISREDNDKKGLVPWTDDRRIVQEFERICGIDSMLKSKDLIYHLRRAASEDPSFEEALTARASRANVNRGDADSDLSQVVESGYAALRAVHLLNSGELREGIKLLRAIAQENPQALPEGSAWHALRGALDRRLIVEIHEDKPIFVNTYAEEILNQLDERGPPESIQDQLVSALVSPDKAKREEGIKVLDLVLEKYPHYLTPDLRKALSVAASDPSMDGVTRTTLLEMLE